MTKLEHTVLSLRRFEKRQSLQADGKSDWEDGGRETKGIWLKKKCRKIQKVLEELKSPLEEMA